MAFRNTTVSSFSIPHLSEIIMLEPDMEPWCAGYAPSKGRRCHMRTNAHGRASAMRLLNQGTADLRAGRCIDTLLENLAPYVLCTRWHQNQAPDLVRRWKRQVEPYLGSRAPRARSGQSTRQSSMSVPSETTRDNVDAQCAVLYQKLRDIMAELDRLRAVQREATVTSNDSLRHGNRQASEHSNTSSTGSSTIESDTVATPDESIEGERPTESINLSPTTGPSEESPVPASDRRPTATSTESETISIVSDPTVRQDDDETDSQTASPASEASSVRRTIDGECGICLCELQTLRSDSSTTVESESEEDDQEQNREQEEGNVGEELVWCKARCGVNFHKSCIDQWLETAAAPTCPTCRSTWEY
ncbi:hypothetical protein BJX96DRAFT_63575 [Aspergillus floccosus]